MTDAGEIEEACNLSMTSAYRLLHAMWEEPERPLFHYTSPEALLKILETQTILATDARYLNDSEELVYVARVVAHVVASIEADTFETRSLAWDIEAEVVHEDAPWSAFVACFTTQGDQLSQWRAYAGDGAGYAIGLSKQTRLTSPDGRIVPLVPVSYARGEQEDMLRPLIEPVVRAYDGFAKRGLPIAVEKARGTLFKFFADLARAFAPVMKNPGFAEEEEWRFVVRYRPENPPTGVAYRAGRFGVTPHLPLTEEGKRLQVKHVVLGPKLKSDIGEIAMKQLLQSHSLNVARLLDTPAFSPTHPDRLSWEPPEHHTVLITHSRTSYR